jgi:hypothetical protein
MDEFTTAAQEPDEAMQEPFEALADDIEEAIDSFATKYHDIDGLDVLIVLKALNAVTTGYLHLYDEDDEDDEGEV